MFHLKLQEEKLFNNASLKHRPILLAPPQTPQSLNTSALFRLNGDHSTVRKGAPKNRYNARDMKFVHSILDLQDYSNCTSATCQHSPRRLLLIEAS